MSTTLAKSEKNNVIGATLLVTGCCIGAGMIGLPIACLQTGFIPSAITMLLSYLFTTITGLLLLEATLWFDQKVNLLSVVDFTLGKKGKVLVGILFLLLFYSIFVAYIDGGGELFTSLVSKVFGLSIPKSIGNSIFVVFIGLISYLGTQSVDKINKILMIGLLLTYCTLVTVGAPHIKLDNLFYIKWSACFKTLPILFICFGFQNLVPSLTYYLKKNTQELRFSIITGNFLALILYLIWDFIILGMVPHDTSFKSDMVVGLINKVSNFSATLFAIQAFTFFALVSSFLAIAISFVDFFKDSFSTTITKKSQKFLIHCFVFLPPLFFSFFNPHVFLKSLEFAGGFVDVILFGILPILIIWNGRYIKKVQSTYTVSGGKFFLCLLLILSIAILFIQI